MRLWSSGQRHPASNRDFRGFESFQTRQLLGVSYRGLLYLTLNQEDVGSNPTAPTNFGLVAQMTEQDPFKVEVVG